MDAPHGENGVVRRGAESVAIRGHRLESVTPERLLRVVPGPRFVWANGDATVAGGGNAETLTGSGPGRVDDIRERVTELLREAGHTEHLPSAAGPRLYGGLAFHESVSPADRNGTWTGFPGAMFVLPAVQVIDVDGETWLTATATGSEADATAESRLETWTSRLSAVPDMSPTGPAGVRERSPTPGRADWTDRVDEAIRSIREGTLRKVVLAQSLAVDLERPLSVPDILERLGETYPDCYRFMFDPPEGGVFFGATPERLVSRRGRTVRTTALAGSIGRGDTEAEDEWLANQLRSSEKDAHEHDLVVEAIRDQFEPLAASVRTDDRTIRRLATVQHLQTIIDATLSEDTHVLSLVDALHPTPAVGGLPPDAALEAIRETEAFGRGWYAAPVGWLDGAGNGTFAVAIRSAVARADRATLFAGDGIVADSDPDREWEELQLKYRPILDELE